MRSPARAYLLAPVLAAILSALELFRTALMYSLEGGGVPWAEFAGRLLPVWATLVVASPWCALMASRFPFRARGVARAAVAHVFGAAAFVLLHMLVIAAAGHLLRLASLQGDHARVAHYYVLHAGLDASAYAGIVVLLLLLEARHEAEARAVAEARLARDLAAARLASLQAQIHPHFLFNTLNALAVLARRGDGAAVDRALVDLGELLRASFETAGRSEIPLGEELAFLERYVALQHLRFPGRLAVEWRVDEHARAAYVPALLLQPLVENAIEHGLATGEGGRLAVTARREGGALELVVTDDGPGFTEGGRAGVGLANVRERLALLHGERATLACANREGGGAEVRLRLPWRDRPTGVSA